MQFLFNVHFCLYSGYYFFFTGYRILLSQFFILEDSCTTSFDLRSLGWEICCPRNWFSLWFSLSFLSRVLFSVFGLSEAWWCWKCGSVMVIAWCAQGPVLHPQHRRNRWGSLGSENYIDPCVIPVKSPRAGSLLFWPILLSHKTAVDVFHLLVPTVLSTVPL